MVTFYNEQSVGARAKLILAEESSYGTAETTASKYLEVPLVSEDVRLQRNTFQSETIRPDRMIPSILSGNLRPDGSLVMETISNKPFSTLVLHTLGARDNNGSATFSDTAGIVFTKHTIVGSPDLTDSGAEGLTLEALITGEQDQYFLFKGGRVNSWRLEVPNEGIVKSTFDLRFANASNSTSSVIASGSAGTPTDDNGLLPLTSFMTFMVLNPSTDNAAIGFIKTLDLTVDNQLNDTNFVLGQKQRANLLPKRRLITGTFTALFVTDPVTANKDVMDFYDAFVNDSTMELRFGIVRNPVEFATYAVSDITDAYGIQIDLHKVRIVGDSPTPVISGEDAIEITVPFQAIYDSAKGTDITVDIVNQESTIHI